MRPPGVRAFPRLLEQHHALAQGGAEPLLLRAQHLLDEGPVLDELRVDGAEALHHDADERAGAPRPVTPSCRALETTRRSMRRRM